MGIVLAQLKPSTPFKIETPEMQKQTGRWRPRAGNGLRVRPAGLRSSRPER